MFMSQKASMHDQHTPSQHLKKGFSLLEIIVVMGLIAVIAGIVYPILNQRRKEATISQARQMVAMLAQSIDRYHDDTGEYPVTLDNLVRRPGTEPASSKWSPGGYLPVKKVKKKRRFLRIHGKGNSFTKLQKEKKIPINYSLMALMALKAT